MHLRRAHNRAGGRDISRRPLLRNKIHFRADDGSAAMWRSMPGLQRNHPRTGWVRRARPSPAQPSEDSNHNCWLQWNLLRFKGTDHEPVGFLGARALHQKIWARRQWYCRRCGLCLDARAGRQPPECRRERLGDAAHRRGVPRSAAISTTCGRPQMRARRGRRSRAYVGGNVQDVGRQDGAHRE